VVAPPAAAVADGEALVALIKSISGVDLTDTLSR
jgi:hypothetical protein